MRDFITLAIIAVLNFVVYFVVGIPLGTTPLTWIFTLGIQSIPMGILIMLAYSRVNKKGCVLVTGLLIAVLQLMNFWMIAAVMTVFVIIAEIVWSKANRKKFSTMVICFTLTMTGWYMGAFLPLIFLKDIYLAAVPGYEEFNLQVYDLVSGWLFFAGLATVVIGCVLGSLLGRAVLKKHFVKAGIVA